MIPSEHEGTVAVDAAARKLWVLMHQQAVASARPGSSVPPENFDDLDPLRQNAIREDVLPMVWAALEALPDRSHIAWARGHGAGVTEGPMAKNPYPA